MPALVDTGGGDAAAAVAAILGIQTPPAPSPVAPPLLGAPPLVSSTPQPGQGVALNAAGGLPTSVTNGLLQLVSAGQHKIAMGTGSLSFAAAATADAVITHGLGAAPTVVLALANLDGLNLWYCSAFGATATQFTVRGVSTAGAATATPTFWWLAIS